MAPSETVCTFYATVGGGVVRSNTSFALPLVGLMFLMGCQLIHLGGELIDLCWDVSGLSRLCVPAHVAIYSQGLFRFQNYLHPKIFTKIKIS